jgi:hypothetical protein
VTPETFLDLDLDVNFPFPNFENFIETAFACAVGSDVEKDGYYISMNRE